jgi:hypothetical protein
MNIVLCYALALLAFIIVFGGMFIVTPMSLSIGIIGMLVPVIYLFNMAKK